MKTLIISVWCHIIVYPQISHGNSKSDSPFYPTLTSTKMDIEEQCSSHCPKNTVRIVSAKLDGVMDGSPCELPRNERQVTYFKNKIASDLKNRDSDQTFCYNAKCQGRG